MRILHVIPSVAVGDGGPAKAVVEMARDAIRRGAQAEIVTTNADGKGVHQESAGEPIDIQGVKITYYPIIGGNYYKVSPALAGALKTKILAADVVHIHSLYQFPFDYRGALLQALQCSLPAAASRDARSISVPAASPA